MYAWISTRSKSSKIGLCRRRRNTWRFCLVQLCTSPVYVPTLHNLPTLYMILAKYSSPIPVLHFRTITSTVSSNSSLNYPHLLCYDSRNSLNWLVFWWMHLIAIGLVWFQNEDGPEYPIAYARRKMKPTELNYPGWEQVLLAIMHALKVCRVYFLDSPFVVDTDHKSLIN